MAEKMKSEMLEVLTCPICHGSVTNAHLCPKCCQHFCRNCIFEWFSKMRNTCPSCRAALTATNVLKSSTLDELQTVIQRAPEPNRCQLHKMHELSMFCYPCEACICPSCSFSEQHLEHKERIVPIEVATAHYKGILDQNVEWMSERLAELTDALDQSQKNETYLQDVKDGIEMWHKKIAVLVASESNATTMQSMLKAEKIITEFRSQSKSGKLLPSGFKDVFVPEPSKLIFRFTKFEETFEKTDEHEALISSCGFIWSCIAEKTEGSYYYLYLKLVQGKASKYGVYLEGLEDEEFFDFFNLNKGLCIGSAKKEEFMADDADEDGDTRTLTVLVRQSYEDRLEQLQDYYTQVEEEKAKSQALWEAIGECWKKYGPLSS